jgi:uncharacterized protein (DUF1501 family)
MNPLNRRQFLLASGVTGAAALAVGAGTVSWRELMHRSTTDPLAAGSPILVILTMYGGNDGVNTVIPYDDPAYHAARPELAYAANEVLPLGGGLGLNPGMTGMAKLWSEKKLAIVRGVGYPDPDFSHFRSMDIWQTASPDEPVNTGWIGRWLDATGDDPVRAVNMGAVLPPLAVGAKAAAAALNVGRSRPLSPVLAAAATSLGVSDPSDSACQAMVTAGYRAERQVAQTFSSISGSSTGSGLDQQLQLVSQCVKAGVPTRVYLVDQGGFDTHADEKGTQQAQLSTVDRAVSGFVAGLAGNPNANGLVLMAYSEFGRRVQANASQGTDHGTSGPVFIVGAGGSSVKGGFYGDEPSLTKLADGNLSTTTDFRSVYGELLSSVLKSDPGQILDKQTPHLGFLV